MIIKKIKSSLKKLLSNTCLLSRGRPQDKVIALTFDDGPHGQYSRNILDILRKENIQATFFVTGREAEKYPELLKLMVQDKHEVCNHSYSHERNAGIDDIKKGAGVIKGITGKEVKFFRPPWGEITLAKLWYALTNNVKIILWSLDSKDWDLKAAKELIEYVKGSKVEPGEIILFHEDYAHTQEALPAIIADLKSREFTFATVGELLK